MHEALGDSWNQAGEFRRRPTAYTAARRLVASDPLMDAGLLLKRSRDGREARASIRRRCAGPRGAPRPSTELAGPEAGRQGAQSDGWYATVLQAEGRSNDAIRWAERAIGEAEAVDDAEALGAAYFVMGWAYGELGKEGVESLLQRSLEAYQRSGNLERQAGLLSNLGVVVRMGRPLGRGRCPTSSGVAKSP